MFQGQTLSRPLEIKLDIFAQELPLWVSLKIYCGTDEQTLKAPFIYPTFKFVTLVREVRKFKGTTPQHLKS